MEDNTLNLVTSQSIKDVLSGYIKALKESQNINQQSEAKQWMIDGFHHLNQEDPILYPFLFASEEQSVSYNKILQQISGRASARCVLPFIPVSKFRDSIQGDEICTPAYLPWQLADNKRKNFVINYSNEPTKLKAISLINQMVMSIILAFPIKKVHVSVLDLEMASEMVFLTANLDNQLVTNIVDDRGVGKLVEDLKADMLSDASTPGFTTQEEFNERQQKIEGVYEIVVIPDAKGVQKERALQQLLPYFVNGHKNGTYFFVLNDTTKDLNLMRPEDDHILKHTEVYQPIDVEKVNDFSGQENSMIRTMSLPDNPAWTKVMFDYINAKVHEVVVKVHDWKVMAKVPYQETDADIVAPIGYNENGEVVNFCMDVNKQHYHAFVIGATGSGKSRFLHNVILSMTTKYSPEDLELYLLDFKGVEFNCYRNFKHVRAVLVDRADERITYEVIKDLKVRMEERQHILAQAGASDVDEYNKMKTGEHLSQIILVADECQTLFADRTKNGKLQNEMVDILALVAQQGRAYGVHLLLATQSLSNAPQLGKEILNQISEHYILPCLPADAAKLVPDHERMTTEKVVAGMKKGEGQCYYQGAEENISFTFNYVSKGEMQQQLVERAENKAESHKSNGQIYFSGSLRFEIDEAKADYLEKKSRRSITASPGQSLGIEQIPLTFTLKDDISENVLLLGINDNQFVTRTSFNVLSSLMISNAKKEFGYRFLVMDCLDDDEAEYLNLLDCMADKGLCTLIAPRKRKEALKRLCDEIAADSVKPTILFIHGQERFRELKLNMEIESGQQESLTLQLEENDYASALQMLNIPDLSGNNTPSKKSDIHNVREALVYILDNGPEQQVHTIMQLDRPINFLFSQDGYVKKQDVYTRFKHLICLKSDESTSSLLGLPDDIRLHQLEDNPDRLRAYYFNEESQKTELITPYTLPEISKIESLINK